MDLDTVTPQHPLLPVEVCEVVIDFVAAESSACIPSSGLAPQYQLRQRQMDLVACALTCRAWLARCVYHLSTRLLINSRRRLDEVAQLLKDDSTAATSVRALYVCSPPRPYHPGDKDQRFSQWSHLMPLRLLGLLPSLDKLVLVDLNWRHVHPSFFLLAPKFTHTITTLWVHGLFFDSPSKFTTILAMFPLLQELRSIDIHFDSLRKTSLGPQVLAFEHLRSVDLLSTSHVAPIASWLSSRTPHLRTLRIDVTERTDALRDWLRACPALSELKLVFNYLPLAEITGMIGACECLILYRKIS